MLCAPDSIPHHDISQDFSKSFHSYNGFGLKGTQLQKELLGEYHCSNSNICQEETHMGL